MRIRHGEDILHDGEKFIRKGYAVSEGSGATATDTQGSAVYDQSRSGQASRTEWNIISWMIKHLAELEADGNVVELRAYNTVHGIWKYFTVDDGQIDLAQGDYLLIGTLETYEKIREYYGAEHLVPIYIEVEDGERLARALERERRQAVPKYKEMCRRFLADEEDFCEENLKRLGIDKRYRNTDMETCLNEITGVMCNGKL